MGWHGLAWAPVRCSERVSSKSSWHSLRTASLDVSSLPARSLSSARSPLIPIAASACLCLPLRCTLHRPLASSRRDTDAAYSLVCHSRVPLALPHAILSPCLWLLPAFPGSAVATVAPLRCHCSCCPLLRPSPAVAATCRPGERVHRHRTLVSAAILIRNRPAAARFAAGLSAL